MGNQVPTCVLPKGAKLNTFLKPEQIRMVQQSWDLIKFDLAKLGVTVFMKFFESEPSMKAVFPRIVQMNNRNQLEYDVDREMLQKHALTVMEGLGAAVESLEDSEFLNSVLIAIGQTHIQRHVKPQMLKKLWPSLNYGLRKFLGDRYDKPTSDAWRKVFTYICIYMTEGMEHPDMDPDTYLHT